MRAELKRCKMFGVSPYEKNNNKEMLCKYFYLSHHLVKQNWRQSRISIKDLGARLPSQETTRLTPARSSDS